jgi:hypothetical protein
MAAEIERLCSKISVIGGGGGGRKGIEVMEGEIAGGREVGIRCLVGQLWAEKPINREAFKTVMSRVWRMARTAIFKELQDNLWLFEFEEEEDKRRVMVGRPWSFDRQILVFE